MAESMNNMKLFLFR